MNCKNIFRLKFVKYLRQLGYVYRLMADIVRLLNCRACLSFIKLITHDQQLKTNIYLCCYEMGTDHWSKIN